jgi:hypothetical protein
VPPRHARQAIAERAIVHAVERSAQQVTALDTSPQVERFAKRVTVARQRDGSCAAVTAALMRSRAQRRNDPRPRKPSQGHAARTSSTAAATALSSLGSRPHVEASDDHGDTASSVATSAAAHQSRHAARMVPRLISRRRRTDPPP